jgi:hypothetical protein
MNAGGKTVMVRVAQCHHEDLRQRLLWDPRDCMIGHFMDSHGRVDHCRGKLF